VELLTFGDLAALRAWIDAEAASAPEALVVFPRVRYGAPLPPFRVAEAAEAFAAAGFVESGRAPVDADRYAVRFAPGKVPVRRAMPRDESWEPPVLSAEYEERLRSHPGAWEFFEKQPPRYRNAATWWVMTGKAEATRERRIAALVEACGAGEKLPQLVRQL
jgi:hypothetical protein